MIRFVDLFAGIGGIRLGFEKALSEFGLKSECVLSSEIDEKAKETYFLNFGEMPEGDIYSIKNFPKFDFLLAGFPCQPFSYAGKQKGFGDTRGTLFFEIERLIELHRPKGFLLENVRGLTTHDKGRTIETIKNKLEKLGYGVQVLLLNSSDFNVPQNRVRVYIVGIEGALPKLTIQSSKGATDSHKYKNLKESLKNKFLLDPIVVRDILEEDPDKRFDCSKSFEKRMKLVLKLKKMSINGVRLIDFRNGNSIHSWELGIKGDCSPDEIKFMNELILNRRKKHFGAHQDGKNLSKEQIKTFFKHPNLDKIITSLVNKRYLRLRDGLYNPVSGNMSFEVFKFLDPDSISITLVRSDAHKLGIFHNGRMRRLTPRECARLQGYPDDFIYNPSDSHAYKQFGNSVSVPVIKSIIVDLLENNPSIQSIGTKKIKKKSARPRHLLTEMV